MEWFIHALKNSFNFKGRARRAEYGWFILIIILIDLCFSLFSSAATVLRMFSLAELLNGLNLLFGLILIIPSINLVTRRLHDLGYSGWWQLCQIATSIVIVIAAYNIEDVMNNHFSTLKAVALIVVLIITVIFHLLLFFVDGDRFENKYGADPKAVVTSQIMSSEEQI
ncbi:DUF805 domain-containing protein [Glaesserella parasuis]|uniref:DUF805 domain-containing protein n=1 Tax=Glaesserella parasuis TaxID=738 RepID=UPI00079FED1B|nr:DUF805 domain-containing protein [Glaesserella parasuis]AMW16564.1 hypothetical protein A4U84_04660 [Glaesserella parasuis]MDO9974172.1 DUF805 domain-containing protein [Glaesserella parasuis]MWQ19512.1 DUF805 domain-containing protein [Glaesserella parasuis]MWQ75451.1 DUF805 domain-containing protein [Glaesserella parasuis]MXO46598.1 DUF805 domain-containing protein [Glaesserella parasuis]